MQTQPIVVSIWGYEGTWKTSVGLSWAALGKLVHYEFDIGGLARALWKVPPEQVQNIVSKQFATPVQLEKLTGPKGPTTRLPKRIVGVKELWQSFVTDYVATVQQQEVQTVMFDSATKLWQIVTRSYLQFLQEKQLAEGVPEDKVREKLIQIEYGEPNDRMATLIYTARSYRKNLVLIHYPRDKYREFINSRGEKESMNTGELEPDGFKETRKLIDLELHTEWNQKEGRSEVRIMNKCALVGVGTKGLGLYLPTPDYAGIQTIIKQLSGS